MIDTHAHLLYYENKEELINSMEEDGLSEIVNIGTTIENSIDGINLAKQYKNVYTTVGIYPEYAEETTEEDLKKLKEILT